MNKLEHVMAAAEDTVALIKSRNPVYHWFRPEHTKEAHLDHMLSEIWKMTDIEKANRWLGYIQGVAAAMYAISLEDLKEINRGRL